MLGAIGARLLMGIVSCIIQHNEQQITAAWKGAMFEMWRVDFADYR